MIELVGFVLMVLMALMIMAVVGGGTMLAYFLGKRQFKPPKRLTGADDPSVLRESALQAARSKPRTGKAA